MEFARSNTDDRLRVMTSRRNELAAAVSSALVWMRLGGDPEIALNSLSEAYQKGVPGYEWGTLSWDPYSWQHDPFYHALVYSAIYYLLPYAVNSLFSTLSLFDTSPPLD